jgi:hypothetical protein
LKCAALQLGLSPQAVRCPNVGSWNVKKAAGAISVNNQ